MAEYESLKWGRVRYDEKSGLPLLQSHEQFRVFETGKLAEIRPLKPFKPTLVQKFQAFRLFLRMAKGELFPSIERHEQEGGDFAV